MPTIPTRPPTADIWMGFICGAFLPENDNKTDRKMYVGGINCSKQNAYAEMIAVQRRFGLRGKVVDYHGIQRFKTGEVTVEQAQLPRRNPQGCCRRVCSECFTDITKKGAGNPAHTYKKMQNVGKRNRVFSSNSQVG